MDIQKLRNQLITDEGRINFIYSDKDGKPTWPGRKIVNKKTGKLEDDGNPTFGIGHLLKRGDKEWYAWKSLPIGGKLTVTDERIEEAFREDIQICLKNCRIVFHDFDNMFEEEKQIIANMIFNMGLARFEIFNDLIEAIKNKDYDAASKEMMFRDGKNPRSGYSNWYKQTKKRATKLVKRMAEIKQQTVEEIRQSAQGE